MEVTIKYKDIIDRCEKLSSFESEGRFDANGESRYLELHINKVDEQLILQYILQARAILEERMERMIATMEDDSDGFTWTVRTDTRWNGSKTFTKHIHEAIVSYAMAAWLRGKLDDRVPFYEGLFNNTLSMAVKNIFTKQPPKK